MANVKIPVYLDCNYDEIEDFIAKMKNTAIESEKIEREYYELKFILNDDLYFDESENINSAYYNLSKTADIIRYLCDTISTTLSKIQNKDEKSRELLRKYVNDALSYATPIDRSKYPNLSDEIIERVYDAQLTCNDFFNSKEYNLIMRGLECDNNNEGQVD